MSVVEDKRLCPHCGGELHRRSYLMSRAAETMVLDPRLICWVVVGAVVLIVISLQHT